MVMLSYMDPVVASHRLSPRKMTETSDIFPYSFEAEIERFGVGKERKIWYNVLFIPTELRQRLPFDVYPRLRVEGEIADVPVANAFIPAGDGRNYVIVAPNVMRNAEVSLGDVVEMRFRIADQGHVEVPAALLSGLEQDPAAMCAWKGLSPGKQRMASQHVLSAKTETTAQRRANEACEAIRDFGGDLRAWRKRTIG
jgi:Bacteriocin-protection, YdeI or OmpD-Associated/Domain of unknown function (DUF1905)